MNPMKLKTLALVVAIIFLLTHSGCTSLNNNLIQTTTAYSENPITDFETEKKKEEREWLLMVLIVLGIAIVCGATIYASSGENGFFIGTDN